LNENVNPTRTEVRAWFQKHRNACRCTGYKPIVDAVMEAAKVMRGEMTMEDLQFKIPANGRIYGTAYPRPAALAKVTGTCDYGTDINEKLPSGTAYHMGLAQAKVSHAKVNSIDVSQAEKMPGVVKVVTRKDIKGTNRLFSAQMAPRSTCDGMERRLLVEDKVYQYGDVYAIVIADTRDHARAASEMVKVDLEQLPEYMNGLEAVQEGAVKIFPERGDNLYGMQPVIKGENTEDIMEKSDSVVEGSYYSQRQPHAVIEPDTMLAYQDENGLWTCQCKALALHTSAYFLCGAVGLKPNEVRMIENPTGASFGYTLSANNYALSIAATMAVDGHPVCLDLDYAQHTYTTGKRAPAFTNAKMSANKDGKITGLEFEILYDKGTYSDASAIILQKGVRFMGFPYTIPNIKGVSMVTCSNNVFTTAFRGFGSPQCYTASEQLVDELAESIGMDPFEFRYKNVYRTGDVTNTGNTLEVYPMVELMDMLRPKYEAAVARAKKESTPEKRRGVGIACGGYNVTGDPNDVAMAALELNADGTVTCFNTWEDQGQGGDIGSLVHTHEALRELNLKPEQIKLVMNDTSICPPSGPAAASRSHYMVGNAIIDAAKQLIQAMKKEDGTFRTHEEMTKEEIPTKYLGNYSTAGQCEHLDPNTGQGNPTPAHMFVVYMAEVEVDRKTGKTKVLKMTTNTDVGVIGSKQAVDGQMYGGMVQQIGLALSEDFNDPRKDTNLIPLGLPYIEDAPDELEINYLETPRPKGPNGSSGCAEVGLTSGQAAVANAIYNACGVRIRELPATPAKVLAGIKVLEAGKKIESSKYFFGMDFEDRMTFMAEHPVVVKKPGDDEVQVNI